MYQIFLIFTFLSIFISGINTDTIFISLFVSLFASTVGLLYLIKTNKKIEIPKHFNLMIVFVLILHTYLILIPQKTNPFIYAVVFSEGLIYWLIFYNLGNTEKILKSILLTTSLIYSLLYFISIVFNISLTKLASVFFEGGVIVRHWNIGDIWAYTLIMLIGFGVVEKFKPKTLLMIGIGLIFLWLSNVRSAYLAFGLGLVYLFSKINMPQKVKKIFYIGLVGLATGFFIFSSLGKTTLFDRPYYIQSIQSFPKFPLGVGMGNFKQIADIYHLINPSDKSLSIVAFNIYFETLSGVGVFSIVFAIFLFKIIVDILKAKGKSVIWGAVLVTILSNFMFDASYATPGLLWLMFIVLGVFQSRYLFPLD